MELKKKIIDFCKTLGIEKVGFIKCEKFCELEKYLEYRKERGLFNEFEETDIEKRINPKLLMENGKTIISIAFPYMCKKIKNKKVYFSKYTLGIDYHIVVKEYLEKIGGFIKSLGGEYKYFVDNNPLPEKYIAMKSGVGFIGKNNCLITDEYGSYIFLGEIITNLVIEVDKPMNNKCGECKRCIISCPTGSIIDNNDKNIENNSNNCMSYITQKKNLEDKWLEKMEGRLWGCDICQDVCPFNIKAKKSNLNEFKPIEYMENPLLEELIKLDNKIFMEKYKHLACSWRGKNLLIRNALITIKNTEKKIPKIEQIKSLYIKEYYCKLFKL